MQVQPRPVPGRGASQPLRVRVHPPEHAEVPVQAQADGLEDLHAGLVQRIDLGQDAGGLVLGGQPPLGLLPPGDVVEDDDPALDRAALVPQRAAGHHDPGPVVAAGVGDVELRLVGRLAADGPHQGEILRGIGVHAIGEEDLVEARPLAGRALDPALAEDSLGGRVEDQESPLGIGDDDAVAHAVQDRLEDPGLLAIRHLGARQLLGVLLEALVEPADLLELPESGQGTRRVGGQGLQRAQIEPVGVQGAARGHLEGAEDLVADHRQDHMPTDARQGDGGRVAPRVGRGVGDDDRAILADRDGQDVVAVERPHGQADDAGHAAGGPHRPDHARLAVHQRDHRQVIAQLGAEPQHAVERLVDVVRVQSRRRDPEERVEQVADGLQGAGPLGDPPLEGRLRAGQLVGHPVERQAQLAEFVRRVDLAPGAQVARGDGGRRPGQVPDRPRDAPGDRVRGPEAEQEQTGTQGQQQPAEPGDRRVGLGGVELGDQAPIAKRRSQRPVGDQHVMAAIVGRPRVAEFPGDPRVQRREFAGRDFLQRRALPGRQGQMDPIAALPADQDLSRVAEAVRVEQERHDRPEIGHDHHGPQDAVVRGPHDPPEHPGISLLGLPRRHGQVPFGPRFMREPLRPREIGDHARGPARSEDLAGVVLEPHGHEARHVRPDAREESLGLRLELLSRQRPAATIHQERSDPRPAGEPGRPILLLLQAMDQHLLPIAGDRRQPVVDLVLEDRAGRVVGGADQQAGIDRDHDAHEQRQLPDDRSPEQSALTRDGRAGRRPGLGIHLPELGAIVDRGHRKGESSGRQEVGQAFRPDIPSASGRKA